MVEKGFRYIVTTLDSIYITPSVSVNENQNEVSIIDMSVSGEPTTRVLSVDSIVGLVKEVYEQIDVYESFLKDNKLVSNTL